MREIAPSSQKFGDVTVIAYDFLAPDDVLSMHEHDAATVHISIVSVAPLLAFGDRGEFVVRPGEIIHWAPGEKHGFRFYSRPSRLINIPTVTHARP
jgi:quercetin dioxygenase-like cupin family protein